MATDYKVGLKPSLRQSVEQWSDEDQDVLLGLIAALAEFGFDVICGARTGMIEGLAVEFVEPGETLEMVWARMFLDLATQSIALRVHQRGDTILLEAG
jgi:hypothetical protein